MELEDKPKRVRRTKEQMASSQMAVTQIETKSEWPEPPPKFEPPKDVAFVKTEAQQAESAQSLKRVYANSQLLDHDLYKLEVAQLTRNASYNEAAPIFEHVEHAHFFHTIDSRGRAQQFCNKVGGHFHEITIDNSGRATCGPAVREVKYKKHGRLVTKYEQIADDNHVHKVTYKFSEKIKPASPNAEFVKVQSKIMEGQIAASSIKVPDVVEND